LKRTVGRGENYKKKEERAGRLIQYLTRGYGLEKKSGVRYRSTVNLSRQMGFVGIISLTVGLKQGGGSKINFLSRGKERDIPRTGREKVEPYQHCG